MSKTNKSFTQQKMNSKPIKMYEEEEYGDDIDDSIYMDLYAEGARISGTKNETMMLAQFLATTGPEEYERPSNIKKQQQFKSAIRLLNRIRKNATRSTQGPLPAKSSAERKKHIPLPVYEILDNSNEQNNYILNDQSSFPNTRYSQDVNASKINNSNDNKRQKSGKPTSLITTPGASAKKQEHSSARDSGVYSQGTQEKEYTSTAYSPISPLPPFTSVLTDLQFPQPPYQFKLPENCNYPNRPAPLPPATSPTATSTACSPTSYSSVSSSTNNTDNSTKVRSVPEAALNRRSVRLRHVQVQTQADTLSKKASIALLQEIPSDKQICCPHCKHKVTKEGRTRRPSCPASLASGPALLTSKDTDDSKMLLAMIIKLRTQLEEEKQCRIRLEKAVRQQQKESDEKKDQLALEKEKWAMDSLWLSDRIAFLPE